MEGTHSASHTQVICPASPGTLPAHSCTCDQNLRLLGLGCTCYWDDNEGGLRSSCCRLEMHLSGCSPPAQSRLHLLRCRGGEGLLRSRCRTSDPCQTDSAHSLQAIQTAPDLHAPEMTLLIHVISHRPTTVLSRTVAVSDDLQAQVTVQAVTGAILQAPAILAFSEHTGALCMPVPPYLLGLL